MADPKPEDRTQDGGQIKLRADQDLKSKLFDSAKVLGIPATKYMLGLLRDGDQATRFQLMLDKKGEPHVFDEVAYDYQLTVASFWLSFVLGQLEASIDFSQEVYDEMDGPGQKPLYAIFRKVAVRRATREFLQVFRRKAKEQDPIFNISLHSFCCTYRALTGFGGKSGPPSKYGPTADRTAWEWGTKVAVYFAVISVEMEFLLERRRKKGLPETIFKLPTWEQLASDSVSPGAS